MSVSVYLADRKRDGRRPVGGNLAVPARPVRPRIPVPWRSAV
jgi:hypothetical protein